MGGTIWDTLDKIITYGDKLVGLYDKGVEAGIIKPAEKVEIPEIPEIPTPPPPEEKVEKVPFYKKPYFPWLIGGGIAASGLSIALLKAKKRRK